MNTINRSTWMRLLILFTMILLVTACQERPTPAPAVVDTEVPVVAAEPTATAPVEEPTAVPTAEEAAPATATPEPVTKTISANLLLDPALAEDPDSMMVNQYLYDGLVRLDASGAPEPALASGWVISEDELSYTFTLRPNLTFSDGTPITPEVVESNFNRWFDRESPLRGGGVYAAWERVFLGFRGEKDSDERAKSLVDGIQVVDNRTVLIHLNRPVADLLTYLADPAFAILSPDQLAAGNYGQIGSQIVASGPYMVNTWTAGELRLVPNPNYWGEKPSEQLLFGLR